MGTERGYEMLYVISKTQALDKLFFVKADSSEEASRMVEVEDTTSNRRMLTDEEVNVLTRNEVALIRA